MTRHGKKNSDRRSAAQAHPRLIDGPPLRGHAVQYSDSHHLLLIDGVIIPCTPTEYRLLMQLLHHAEHHVPFARLLSAIHTGPLDRSGRRVLSQYMSRMRAKVWPFGFDIFCITGYGYTLLPKTTES